MDGRCRRILLSGVGAPRPGIGVGVGVGAPCPGIGIGVGVGAPRRVIPDALTRPLTKRDAAFSQLLCLLYILSVTHISFLSGGVRCPRGCPSSIHV